MLDFDDLFSTITATVKGVSDTVEDVVSGLTENIQETPTTVATEPVSYLDSDGSTTGRIPNPLRDYNSYNYVITLGVLNSEQLANPESYRSEDFNSIIFRSGGGAYDKRVQTAYELSSDDPDLLSKIPEAADPAGDHTEYFIEDLEIDAVVAPNQNTRVSLGTNVKFKVIEPYSMGQFIESLAIGALENGFENYTKAPYCLKIDFIGWFYNTLQNAGTLVSSSYIPIQIIKMDFQVTEQGSVYEIEAVAYNDAALADHINENKTPITITGKTVAELLSDVESKDSNSLTKVLNSRIEDLEKNNQITGYDRYAILFPTDLTEMNEKLNGLIADAGITSDVDDTGDEVTVTTNISLYESIKSLSSSSDQINEIGNSIILDGKDSPISKMTFSPENAALTIDSPADASTNDSQAGSSTINRSESSYKNPLVKNFQYEQNEKITNIIEDIYTRSEYASRDGDGSGFVKSFKIQTKVLLDSNPDIVRELGRPAMIYVYMVVPHLYHESKTVGPAQVARGMDQIRANARKEYNYYYTGLNEDVLDFKINFNNAYFATVHIDLGKSSAKPQSDPLGTPRKEQKQTSASGSETNVREVNESAEQMDTRHGNTGTGYTSEYGNKTRLAKLILEKIINSPVDMITAEIDIWGDPYFIPSDIGNYSPDVQSYALSIDNTMSYVNNEVYIIVNFKTPYDYQKDGNLMDMQQEYTTFSGVYQVWGVTNIFSNGEFKQNLKLIRINKQTQEETATTSQILKENGNYILDNYSINGVLSDIASVAGSAGQVISSTVNTLFGTEPVTPGVNDTSAPSNNVDTVEPASSSVSQTEANNPIPQSSVPAAVNPPPPIIGPGPT